MHLLRNSFFSRYHSPSVSRQRRPILARSLLTLLAPVVAITGLVGLPVTAKGVVVLTKSGTIILDSLVGANDVSTLSTTTSGSSIQISGTGATTQLFTGVTQLRINFGSTGQTVTLDSTNFSFTPTVSVGTSGAGTMDAIVKNGANTVKFSGSNNYIGGTTVNGGAISIDNANALGSGVVTLKAGTELTSSGTISLANAINFAATGTNTISTTGTLTLNDLAMSDGTVVFGSAGHAGIVSIANDNTSAVNAGTHLQVAFGTLRNDGQLNFFSSTAGMMTVNSGATLAVNDINMGVNHLQGAGKVTLGTKAATNLTIDNGSFDGVISGSGLVTAMGNVTLNGANTYTGGTQINTAAVLQIGNGGTTGAIVGNIADSGLLVFARSNAMTYAGPIGGTGGLQQSGTGVLTLTGTNTYSGGTIIQSGKLSIGKAAAIGTGTVTLLPGTELTTTGTVNLPQLVSFATTGTSTISTTGTLVLNRIGMATTAGAVDKFGSPGAAGIVAVAGSAGSSVSTGTKIEVAYGTLRNDGGLGYYSSGEASGFVVDSGATLSVNDHSMGVYGLSGAGKVTLGTNASTNLALTGGSFSGVISGAGSVTASVGEAILSGANTYTGGSTINGAATLQVGGGATSTTGSIVGPVGDAGALVFFRSNAVSFAGAISGSGSVTQAGAGVLTLTGNSSFTGGTTIANGKISISNGNALGTGPVHLSAGTELTTTGTVTLANPIDFDIGGSSTVSTTGTLSLQYLSMGLGTNSTVIFGSAGHTGIIAVPSGTGNIDASTKIEVAFGTLRNDLGLGVYTSHAASTTVDTGATLAVNDHSMTVQNLQGAGKITLGTQAATQLTVGGGSFSGVISGTGGIISSGALILSGANTYAGGTQIAASSSLQVGAGGTTGSIVGNVTSNTANSELIFDRSNAVTFAGIISGSTIVNQNGPGVTTLTGNNSYSGGTRIDNGAVSISKAAAIGTNNILLNPGGELTTTGTITLDNGITFGSGGSGTLSTSGTLIVSNIDMSAGAGSTAVFGSAGHAGTIGVASGTASADTGTQMLVADGTVRNDGGLNFFTSNVASTTVNAGATLAVNDSSITVKSLQGAGKVTLGTKAATALTIESGNFSGVISGAGHLNTTNLTLSGANTYTGGTTVSGSLVTNNTTGSATGSGPVDVTTNAVLGGNGKISGAITLESNSILYPGAGSPGTAGSKLHGSSMIWNGNATLKFQIGATADELMLTGALTKGTGNTFTIDIFDTGIVDGNYTLLTFGSTNFSLSNFTLALPTNYTGMLVETSTSLMIENLHGPSSMKPMAELPLAPSSFSDASAGDSSSFQAVPAPEPNSAPLLTLGLGSLLGHRRRNRG